MTKEEHREYARLWRQRNKERIKQREQETARQKALAAMISVKCLDANVCIVRANDGRQYLVGGRKR